MTAAEYLCRPDEIRQEIARIRSRIEALRRLAGRLTLTLRDVRVQTSADPHAAQALLAEAADAERGLSRLEEALQQAVADTARYISVLPDGQQIRVLALRYLEGRRWEDVAALLDYSARNVFRLHRLALSLLPPPPELPEEEGFPE